MKIMAENQKKTLSQKLWEQKLLRYSIIFLGSVIADYLIALYTYSLTNGWIVVQAIVGFIIPFVNFLFHSWWVETKSVDERFMMTFASALGMATGSTIMLLTIGK